MHLIEEDTAWVGRLAADISVCVTERRSLAIHRSSTSLTDTTHAFETSS
jgi:hypothetical protein